MKGDPLLTVRATIARLQADRRRIECAPVPLVEAIARMHAALDRASAGRLSVSLRSCMDPEGAAAIDFGRELQTNPTALLCWLHGDRIAALLEADLREAYAAETITPMPEAERDAALAKIARDLRAAEVAEERLVREAERAGGQVERREDASPEIVLMED